MVAVVLREAFIQKSPYPPLVWLSVRIIGIIHTTVTQKRRNICLLSFERLWIDIEPAFNDG